MVSTARLKPVLRATLLGASLVLLAGCSIFGGKDDETNNANKDAAAYRERSVEQIYADGWRAINAGAWDICAATFNEVDRQHPYSVWARRAMLISAFCAYQANAYPAAIATAEQYISLHPGSPEVAYAFYIKAIALYEQIVDIGRYQSNTEGALVALQDVLQRHQRAFGVGLVPADIHDLLVKRNRLNIEGIGHFRAAGMQGNILVGGRDRGRIG